MIVTPPFTCRLASIETTLVAPVGLIVIGPTAKPVGELIVGRNPSVSKLPSIRIGVSSAGGRPNCQLLGSAQLPLAAVVSQVAV